MREISVQVEPDTVNGRAPTKPLVLPVAASSEKPLMTPKSLIPSIVVGCEAPGTSLVIRAVDVQTFRREVASKALGKALVTACP